MKSIAQWTQKDYLDVAARSGRPQLLTIPYSHFCELAQWSLDLGGVDYEHRAFLPGQHILPVLKVRIGSEDSWDVAEVLAKFEPAPVDLKKKLDEELGPLSRQLAYAWLLKLKNRNVWNDLCSNGGTSWFWWFAGTRVTKILEDTFRPHDAEAVQECEGRLQEAFASLAPEAEERLARLAAGGRPGLADLAMAALAAAVVSPPQYCRGEYAKAFDALAAQDDAVRQSRDAWHATPVGRLTLRMYRDHRMLRTSAL